MEELFAIKNIYGLYKGNEILVMASIMIIAFYPLLAIIKHFILPGVKKVADKKNENYSKIFAKNNLTSRIVWAFSGLYLMFWSDIFNNMISANPTMIFIENIILTIYIIISITLLLLSLMNILVDIYKTKGSAKRISIELHMHILKIIVIVCSALSIISLILGISISSLFTSLGAAAALLTFVFKDTVLGLLASLQITFQNIIKVGDWVSLPQYNADGDVEKITITVVVIRNFDQTYTTVPTSAFLTTGVKNWRPMFEKGGRRIKRSINIDIHTIKICEQKILDLFKKMPCMSDFVKENPNMFKEESGITNISMFRYYIQEYLKSNQDVHQEGFTFLVRALEPSPNGIPIELYVFTKNTSWVNYESVQGDIFDHLLGIMPQFELKSFQTVLKH